MSDLVQELRARNAYLSLDEAADRTAFLAADSASGDEGWGKVCAHCGRRYTRSLAQCPWIGCQTNADQPELTVDSPTAKGG